MKCLISCNFSYLAMCYWVKLTEKIQCLSLFFKDFWSAALNIKKIVLADFKNTCKDFFIFQLDHQLLWGFKLGTRSQRWCKSLIMLTWWHWTCWQHWHRISAGVDYPDTLLLQVLTTLTLMEASHWLFNGTIKQKVLGRVYMSIVQ